MNIREISKITVLAAAIIGAPVVIADDAAKPSGESATHQQGSNAPGSESPTHAGTVKQNVTFEVDSVILTDGAQDQLDTLARSLDKDTPAKVIIQVEGQRDLTPANGDTVTQDAAAVTSDGRSSVDDNLADSSGANQTIGTEEADYGPLDADSASRLSQEIRENERLISVHRAERVRQFLEDRGVEVTTLIVETPDQQDQSATANSDQSENQDVQQVLIVITESGSRENLSAR